MMDIVVTVPKPLWEAWVYEGDLPGSPEIGEVWGFFTQGPRPDIAVGERVYVVSHGRLRGYAPLVELGFEPSAILDGVEHGRVVFGRPGGAVAATISEAIRGFPSWRARWWRREDEVPFPEWKTEGVSR